MTSDKQVQANRKNALASSGPKDVTHTRFNALKHGLLAKEVVVLIGPGKENKEEFQNLCDDLVREMQPVDRIESLLVEKVAVCFWRLRRTYQAERGGIMDNFTMISYDVGEKLDSKFSANLVKSDEACLLPKHKAEKLLSEREGQLVRIQAKNISKQELLELFSFRGNLSEEELLRQAEAECNASINFLQLCIAIYDQRFDVEFAVSKALRIIPSNHELIARYETTVERQLYRTLAELERLQARRRGEVVPTLNVNINKAE